MHSILNLRMGSVVAAVALILFAACKQAPNPNPNPADGDDNGGYASDGSRIELATEDAISLADAAGALYNGAYMRTTHTTLGTCALVGYDTLPGEVHTLTIYFGAQDCTCLDGRVRRGSITITYNGNYPDAGQVHTITFSNYYLNDNQLTGTINYTRVDTTVVGAWYYNVTVHDTLNMSPDPLKSQYVIWDGTLVRKWIVGQETLNRNDDVFSISGSANLTRANGHQFSFDIGTPLQFAVNCDYCESGLINVYGLNGGRILNYGAGACDAVAQVTIGTAVNQIALTK